MAHFVPSTIYYGRGWCFCGCGGVFATPPFLLGYHNLYIKARGWGICPPFSLS